MSKNNRKSTSGSRSRGVPGSTRGGAPGKMVGQAPRSTNQRTPASTGKGIRTNKGSNQSKGRNTSPDKGTNKNANKSFMALLRRRLRRWKRHPGRPLLCLLILAVVIFLIFRGCSGKEDKAAWEKGDGRSSNSSSNSSSQAADGAGNESQAQGQQYQDTESADPAAIVSEASDPAAVETEEPDGLDGFVASAAGVSAHLCWHEVSGADGYLVFRQKSSGEGSGQGMDGQEATDKKKSGKDNFKQIADLSSADLLVYDDREVKMNHAYDYYVAAYQEKDGEKQILDTSEVWGVDINWYAKEFKIDDTRSPLCGKKVRYLYYSDDTRIMDPLSVMEKPDKYYIYVNKTACQVVVYVKDKKVFVPVKSFVCSPGKDTPCGTFNTTKKYRWLPLSDKSFGQWSTRIVEHILFHSVMYAKEDNRTLNVKEFNKLGTLCSHGCVRMQAGDAKWIYDNCEIGTRVTIYESDGFEPFEVPVAPVLDEDHTWDPSDPEVIRPIRR